MKFTVVVCCFTYIKFVGSHSMEPIQKTKEKYVCGRWWYRRRSSTEETSVFGRGCEIVG